MHTNGENQELHSFCMHEKLNCKKQFCDDFHLACEAVLRFSNFLQKKLWGWGQGQMLLVAECLQRISSYHCLGYNFIRYMD